MNKYWTAVTTLLIILGLTIYSSKSAQTNAEAVLLAPQEIRVEPKPVFITTSIESVTAPEELLRIQKFLDSRNSPMSRHSVDFFEAAQQYNIDPYLLPAISGVESSFGAHHLSGSYNSFGWANGNHYFSNYKDAIYTVAKTLREKYVKNDSEITPSKIGRIYATSWPTWIPKVERMKSMIQNTRID